VALTFVNSGSDADGIRFMHYVSGYFSDIGKELAPVRNFKVLEAFKSLQSRKLAGVVETSGLLAAMALADLSGVFPFSLTHLQPHPFWLPVILAASIYGRSVGYIIAALAALIDSALDWPDLARHSDFYDFLIAISSNAVMWLGAATVLGAFRENHLERLRETKDAHDQRAAEAQILSDRCRSLIREVAKLENRIAASGGSAVGKTLELFERLVKMPAAQAFEGYRQALHLLIGADGVELYVPSQDGWLNALPGKGDEAGPALDPAMTRICGTVGAGNRVYSCVRELDREVLTGRAALAAPIRSSEGELLGVVLVREADPACLSRAGEVAIALGNFILGARHFEYDLPALEDAAAFQTPRQLQSSAPRITSGASLNAQVGQ
jgi:polysaccharide biosynthesis protein PelD